VSCAAFGCGYEEETMRDPRLQDILRRLPSAALSRRDFVKRTAVVGLSIPTVGALLAACEDDDPDDDIDDVEEPDTDDTDPVEDPDDDEPDDDVDDVEEEEDDEDIDEPDDDEEDDGVAEEPAETGGYINWSATTGDSGIANPILNGRLAWVEWWTFNRLFRYDDVGEILHDLAEDFEISDDGLTWTFHLNEANWHDGEPFDADDVLFTFETVVNEDVDTGFGSRLRVAGEQVEWSAPDERTVEIVTPEAFGPFLYALSEIAIIPEHVLADVDDINTAEFNTNPVGTGPYMWAEREPDQWLRLERFDDYFGGTPAAEGITIFYVSDVEAASASLDSGEVDYMFAPPELQPRYLEDPDVRVLQYTYFTPITLCFNHRHPILQEYDVRRAIAHAIDRQSLMDTVTVGLGLEAQNQYAQTAPVLDDFNDYDNVNYAETYPYDPDEARSILDEIGFEEGDDGIRERDGDRMSFTLLTYAGFDEYQNAQQIIQSMLAEIGIEVQLDVLEYTTLQGMWGDPDGDPMERAMEVQEWPHPFEMDPDVHAELHSQNFPPAGDNYMYFEDEEVDRLIDEGRSIAELEERIPVYHELDQRRLETLPCLPLYCAVDARLLHNRVESTNDDNPLDDTPSMRWWERAFIEYLYKPDEQ
jgi:peptide/nickel transport system substrate-binding protein